MRFFAHDGSTVHGPSALEELMRLPGFDGDTLVCPVGSENSEDWKPALAYPPFREALLAAAPKLAPPPPPPPPAPAPTRPCPACAHANPEGARFCNECAARMDGRVEPPPPAPAPLVDLAPAPEPAPVFIPEQAPAPETFAPESPSLDLDPLAISPEPAAEPAALAAESVVPAAAAAPAVSGTSRNILIASFIGAVVASGAFGYWLLRPAKKTAPPAAETPAASVPPAAPAPAAVPVSAAPVPAPATAPPASSLTFPTETPAAPPAKRARKKPRRKKPAPPAETKSEDTLIESPATVGEPAMPDGRSADGGRPAAAQPAADQSAADKAVAAPAAAPAENGFMLPGVPRPVASHSIVKAKPGAAAAPAAEDATTHQVQEQFEFCAQLLAQGAYADHYDTCLCAEARQDLPYRGRRGFYAATLKKASDAGTLETIAKVSGVVIDGGVARVTARWRTAAAMTSGNVRTESWQLEDGLWCRNP